MGTHYRQRTPRRLPGWAVAALDVLLIAATLLVYALFQHVLPAYRAAAGAPALAVPTVSADVVAVSPTEPPVTETAAPTPTAEPTWAEKFAEHFTAEIVSTDSSYTSPYVSVTVTEHTSGEGNSAQRWYVADIYLTDIRCFQTYMPGGTYNQSVAYMPALAEEAGALVAVNGDFASLAAGGVIIRNGTLFRDELYNVQICVLYDDGTMACYDSADFSAADAMANGAWQAWSFGPSLLDGDGQAKDTFSCSDAILGVNPRTAIGYYEPGHYCFVVVDGRQPGAALGFDMPELSQFFADLGCRLAFNLDGGRSSQMVFAGRTVDEPVNNGRYINDIVLIRDILSGEDGT